VEYEVTTVESVGRQGESDPQPPGDRLAGGIGVHELDPRARERGQNRRDARTDHAATDHRDPVADQRMRVPHRVHGRLDGAREHRASRRNPVGHRRHGALRDHVTSLMWIETEHGAPAQLFGPVFNHAHVEVPVLDRPREVTLLERGAHRRVLVLRHPTAEDERLRSSADAREQRAHLDLTGTGLGQCDLPNLPVSRFIEPKGTRRTCHSQHLRRTKSTRGTE
jgi:hypothetical protein